MSYFTRIKNYFRTMHWRFQSYAVDEIKNNIFDTPYNKECRKLILEFIKKSTHNNDAKILEVGIGSGQRFSMYLFKKDYNIYGIDIDKKIIKFLVIFLLPSLPP